MHRMMRSIVLGEEPQVFYKGKGKAPAPPPMIAPAPPVEEASIELESDKEKIARNTGKSELKMPIAKVTTGLKTAVEKKKLQKRANGNA